MTNKEAADILRLMPKQSDAILKAIEVLESENYYKSLAESYGETINKLTTAISETKQEPILEIRAEIEKLQKMCDRNDLNLLERYSAFGMVLDIIDKYREESEGKE